MKIFFKRHLPILLYLVFLFYPTVLSQEEILFKHLSINEGLSQSSVQCVFQDSKGYMWFGTRNGLNKYDGYKFSVYHNIPGDSTSLSGNRIEDIIEDSTGKLWVSTFFNGVCSYNRKTDDFTQYKIVNNSVNERFNKTVAISIDKRNNVWVSSHAGISKYNRAKDSFEHISNDIFFKNENVELTRDLIDYSENELLIGTDNKYFYKYNIETKDIDKIPFEDTNTLIGTLKTYLLDSNNDIWVGGFETGLFQYNYNLELVHDYSKELKSGNEFQRNIKKVIQLKDGSYCVGSDGNGLYTISQDKKVIKNYIHHANKPFSLADNTIYDLFEDNSGIIWLGHFNNGISYYNRKTKKFYSFIHNSHHSNSISEKPVLSIFEDSKNRIWIGTDGGGLNLFDKESKTFSHFTVSSHGLSSNVITAINEDSKGNLLLGTWSKGFMVFNPDNGIVKSFNSTNSNLIGNSVWSIIKGENNRIWLAILGNRDLFFYDDNTYNFKSLTNHYNLKNIIDDQFMTLMKDSKGNIWMGSEGGGVYQYRINEKRIVKFRNNPNNKNSLIGNVCMALFEDSKGNIWMGTIGHGVSIYNPNTKKFKHLTINDGLPSNAIVGIIEDDNNTFWLSTIKGASHYIPSENRFENFDKTDGLQGDEFKYNATIMDSDKQIYMGGMRGLTIFDPKEIKIDKLIPPVYISGFKLFGEEVKIGTKGSPLKAHISETDTLVLNHQQSVFSLSFVALNYIATEKNQYKYKMIGFDKIYQKADKSKSATYMNLPPGEYTFHVMASNNDNIWNKEGAKLKILIIPPWWETWWFKVLFVLVFVLLVIAFYHIRFYQLKKQKTKLTRLVALRTEEINDKNKRLRRHAEDLYEVNTQLEERQQRIEEQSEELSNQAEMLSEQNEELKTLNETKDRFFSIIAHDLKSPFSTLLGLSNLLEKRYEKYSDSKRKELLKQVNITAQKIFKLLENLLIWSRSQIGQVKLNLEKFKVDDVLYEISGLFSNVLKEKEIILEISINDQVSIMADKNMVKTVFRNLISNSIKYTEKGKIIVKAKESGKYFEFSIKDTGIGMSPELSENIFGIAKPESMPGTQGESGTGLGLLICKDFIEANNGKIWVESKEGEGTTFYFNLPKS